LPQGEPDARAPRVSKLGAMFDSSAVPWLTVYGLWLIGGIAGLVAFLVTAAIVGVIVRRRDRITLKRPRRPLPGAIPPYQPSLGPSRQAPHLGWLLVFLAVALIGAVMVVLWTP
jgi:hypothetical protein